VCGCYSTQAALIYLQLCGIVDNANHIRRKWATSVGERGEWAVEGEGPLSQLGKLLSFNLVRHLLAKFLFQAQG